MKPGVPVELYLVSYSPASSCHPCPCCVPTTQDKVWNVLFGAFESCCCSCQGNCWVFYAPPSFGNSFGTSAPHSGLSTPGLWAPELWDQEVNQHHTGGGIFRGSWVCIGIRFPPGNLGIKIARYWGMLCLLWVNEIMKLIKEGNRAFCTSVRHGGSWVLQAEKGAGERCTNFFFQFLEQSPTRRNLAILSYISGLCIIFPAELWNMIAFIKSITITASLLHRFRIWNN